MYNLQRIYVWPTKRAQYKSTPNSLSKKQNKLKTKTSVVFVVKYVVQTMRFHAKPGKLILLVPIISHIQIVLRQKVLVDRHTLIGLYCALLVWILYGLIIFQLILIIDIQIATNQYLNLLHRRGVLFSGRFFFFFGQKVNLWPILDTQLNSS